MYGGRQWPELCTHRARQGAQHPGQLHCSEHHAWLACRMWQVGLVAADSECAWSAFASWGLVTKLRLPRGVPLQNQRYSGCSRNSPAEGSSKRACKGHHGLLIGPPQAGNVQFSAITGSEHLSSILQQPGNQVSASLAAVMSLLMLMLLLLLLLLYHTPHANTGMHAPDARCPRCLRCLRTAQHSANNMPRKQCAHSSAHCISITQAHTILPLRLL